MRLDKDDLDELRTSRRGLTLPPMATVTFFKFDRIVEIGGLSADIKLGAKFRESCSMRFSWLIRFSPRMCGWCSCEAVWLTWLQFWPYAIQAVQRGLLHCNLEVFPHTFSLACLVKDGDALE